MEQHTLPSSNLTLERSPLKRSTKYNSEEKLEGNNKVSKHFYIYKIEISLNCWKKIQILSDFPTLCNETGECNLYTFLVVPSTLSENEKDALFH